MMELKVIGVERGKLVLVSEDGERYAVAIDETLQSQLRPPVHALAPREKRVSPREIQAHIRSGLSAAEVAELTGAPIEYVERFEGPVAAEREHVVASALGVRVYTTADPDPLEEGTPFGDVMRERLSALGAEGEQWSSWKDQEEGWIVKLLFTSDSIDHDARWSFDPKKGTLRPVTAEATALSQQGELRPTLLPRLRAVAPPSVDEHATRFDTDAFAQRPVAEPETRPGTPAREGGRAAAPHARPPGRTATSDTEPQPTLIEAPRTVSPFPRSSAQTTTEQRERNLNDTADLLDALRRRRGERDRAAAPRTLQDLRGEPLTTPDESPAPTPAPAADPVTPPVAERVEAAPERTRPAKDHPSAGSARGANPRRGRTSMPSWDEIVFGARSDD